MTFAAIGQSFVNYYDELPNDIISTVAKSAFYTFTIALLFSTKSVEQTLDITRPLIKAGVAALASFIHALMTPLFNKVFGTTQLNAVHELVKSCVVAVLTSTVMNLTTTSQVNLLAFRLFYLISSNSFIAWLGLMPANVPLIKENSTYVCF